MATTRPSVCFFSSRRRHTSYWRDWSSDVCSSDLLSPFTPMLFQGEEHGECHPFQFFSDHIDEEIAQSTREGRLREFAQFEAFAGQVPDPQDPATFERSKLSREGDPAVRALYERLLRARRDLAGEETSETSFDEDARWLCVRRGAYELACNFAEAERR